MRRACSVAPFLLVIVACGGESSAPAGEAIGSVAQPIVGGYVDDKTTGVVALALTPDPGHPFVAFCSGSLLAPNLVLTARHCVSRLVNAPNDRVQCGVSTFSQTYSGDVFFASPDTVRPADPSAATFFRGVEVRVPDGATEFCGHDVALIVLAGSGIPAELATPIEPRLDSVPSPDEKFSADGFGLTDPLATTDTGGTRMRLDAVTVRCAGTACQALQDVRADEWMSVSAKTCPGDSGGPALDDKGRVMGVASRGAEGCGTSVYGDVSSWRDLIIQTARDAAARGGYDAPFWAAEADAGGGAVPVTTPLGEPCTSACADGYACYAEAGQKSGICVPRCGGTADSCPSGYACSSSLGACLPSAGDPASSGCALAPRVRGGRGESLAWTWLGALGLAAFGVRRARRRR